MGCFDHETNCRSIYFLAGATVDEYLTPRQLVRRLPAFGDDGLSVGGQTRGTDASLEYVRPGQWVIHVGAHLDYRASNQAILHEVAEWYLRDEIDPRKELACDELAMTLGAPRAAVLFVARELSCTDVEGAARVFDMKQSEAAIRLAEVTRRPLALVRATSIGFAGPEWGWPDDEHMLRRLAAGRDSHPRVTAVRATDERQLTLLFGED